MQHWTLPSVRDSQAYATIILGRHHSSIVELLAEFSFTKPMWAMYSVVQQILLGRESKISSARQWSDNEMIIGAREMNSVDINDRYCWSWRSYRQFSHTFWYFGSQYCVYATWTSRCNTRRSIEGGSLSGVPAEVLGSALFRETAKSQAFIWVFNGNNNNNDRSCLADSIRRGERINDVINWSDMSSWSYCRLLSTSDCCSKVSVWLTIDLFLFRATMVWIFKIIASN